MLPKYDIEGVKASVPLPTAIETYAHIPTRRGRGRCPCPIHGGDNNNLSYDDHRFYCFTCGARGDVINFVQQLFGLPFAEALDKLARDFGIAPGVDPAAIRERQRKIDARRRREQADRDNFQILATLYHDVKDAPPTDLQHHFAQILDNTLSNIISHSVEAYSLDAKAIDREIRAELGLDHG